MTRASLRHRDLLDLFRSSHRSCSVEKCVLEKIRKFPRKTPVLESLLNSAAGRNIICEILLLFVSPQNTITNSSGEFGLDETTAECKVNIF